MDAIHQVNKCLSLLFDSQNRNIPTAQIFFKLICQQSPLELSHQNHTSPISFIDLMGGSRRFPQGGPDVYLVVNVFHKGLCKPPSRSNWTLGSNCFSRGVSTCISKEVNSHLFNQGVLAFFSHQRISKRAVRTSLEK